MHAFVVTNKKSNNCLDVCEAVSEGIMAAEIKMGDTDWTSMVLFVPKNEKVADQVVLNAMHEIKPDEKGKLTDYGFFEGFKSLFIKREKANNQNVQIVAREMADLIKHHKIRDASGDPRACVCSQLAMRVLRSSILLSQIPEEKIERYRLLSNIDLEAKLIKKLAKHTSELSQAFRSSTLFDVQAHLETLPYELYLALKNESDLH